MLPLFALANAGVAIPAGGVVALLAEPVTLGVAVGLLIGKPVGIFCATWLAVRAGVSLLPAGIRWVHVTGAGLLGGIGFTVALFVAGLGFSDVALADAAKIGILTASALSGVLGASLLLLAAPAGESGNHRAVSSEDHALAA